MFYNRVFETAYFVTLDEHLAQDVVQETFLKAFRNIDKLKDGTKMGAWLAVIATRTALDLLKKTRNIVITEESFIDEEISKNSHTPSVENVVEEKYIKNLLRQQVQELIPEHRQVVVLKYEYDLNYEEIAKELGISTGTVKSRLYRAKQKLKLRLEKEPAFQNRGAYYG